MSQTASPTSSRRRSRQLRLDQLVTVPWCMDAHRVRGLLASVNALLRQRSINVDGEMPDNGDTYGASDTGYEILPGGVAKIPIVGILTKYPSWLDEYVGFIPSECVMESLNRAVADHTVKAIALLIDSPGGTFAGTNQLGDAVAAANKIKPCVAVVSDRALSGGYYVAASCGTITCNAGGMTGCIGVYSVLTDTTGLQEQLGIVDVLITSGGVKGLGADGKVSAELKADVQREIDGMYGIFVDAVARGRRMKPDQAKTLADGRSWLGADALSMKLIDFVMPVPEALASVGPAVAARAQQPNNSHRGNAAKGSTVSQQTMTPPPAGCSKEQADAYLKSCWASMNAAQRSRWLDEACFVVGCRDAVTAGTIDAKFISEHIFTS
jgi:signal peptide peptidase SppA